MAEPLSVASGVAGIITLSSAVVAAGYKYFSLVRSAPEDLRNLIREISLLHTLVSQFVAHSMDTEHISHGALDALVDQEVFQDCFATLKAVQTHLDNSQPVHGDRSRNALRVLAWPLKKEDIAKGRERIGRLCALLTTASTLDNTLSLERLEKLQLKSLEHAKAVLKISHSIEERKMLDWLSMLDPRPKHVATKNLQQPGTSDWLLQRKSVTDWIDQGGFLWLNGSSGTGKTVLVSNMIEHLQETSSPLSAVAYHYCEFANAATLDPHKIAGSLARQLVEQTKLFPKQIRDAYNEFSRSSPSLDILIAIIHHLVGSCFRTVYFIIDGVDECPIREQLLQLIRAVDACPAGVPRLNVLVSSRPEHDLRKAWSGRATFSITPMDVEDSLTVHVREEIAKIPKLSQLPASDQLDLIVHLVSRAEGMFRWIHCQLDVLRKIRTQCALGKALKTLPTGLVETYDRILDRIDEQDHDYVVRVIKWLIGAEHPLSFQELAEAVAVDPNKMRFDSNNRFLDPEELLELCGSLISVRPDGIIVLAHFSVREYLLSDRLAKHTSSLARFALTERSASQFVSQCILTYLVTVGVELQNAGHNSIGVSKYPLLQHIELASITRYHDFDAVQSWVDAYFPLEGLELDQFEYLIDYTKSPSPIGENRTNAALVQHILQTASMCYWNACSCAPQGDSSEAARQIKGIFLGLQQKWQHMDNLRNVRNNSDINIPVSPLCTAASQKFLHSLRSLLENGALINGTNGPRYVGNPLMRSLQSGCEAAVSMLHEFGADFNLRVSLGTVSTALTKVAKCHPTSNIFSELLFKYQSDLNLVDSYGRTIHYWAAKDSFMARSTGLQGILVRQGTEIDRIYQSKKMLYTTIVDIVHDMQGLPSLRHHYGRARLSKALEQCGPDYYTYATIVDEQALVGRDMIISPYWCDICPQMAHQCMRGTRFSCTDCINTDFCADCYSTWQKSDGGMEICKGHTFREIPRPCWYTFEPGIVTQDGKTIMEVIDYLYDHFSGLLSSLDEGSTSMPS